MDKIRRDKITVALEAVFIGILNYMIFTFVSTMGVKNTGRALVLAGALIHLGFEYSPSATLTNAGAKSRSPTDPLNSLHRSSISAVRSGGVLLISF